MNYLEIDTAEDVLNAFKACQNAGEEIQLFESLAERANPPVDAFVEILRKIKLETVLALAIQAFGKITNDDVKARLKGSEDLLVMLCEQAKSGTTDLIRWSAATTIEKVGFSFIDVSQYLTEEPSRITHRIVQSKINVFINSPEVIYRVAEQNNYDVFVRFWIYGYTYGLRIVTINMEIGVATFVVREVVKAQDIWGIKQTNSLFKVLESQTRLDDDTKNISENQVFEKETQLLVAELLKQNRNPTDFQFLVINQIHCLQSNVESVRKDAALILMSLDDRILDVLKQQNSALSSMIAIFSKDSLGERYNFSYQEVVEAIRYLEILEQYLIREITFDYCKNLHEKLSHSIEDRKEKIDKEKREIARSEQDIIDTLNKIELTFPQIYSEYSNIDRETMPEVNVEDDKWEVILSQYHYRTKTIIGRLKDSIIQEEKKRRQEENRIKQEEGRRLEEKRKYLASKDNVKEDLLKEMENVSNSSAKRDLTEKITAASKGRVSANFFWLILLSPFAIGIAFLVLYLPVGFFVAIVTLNTVSWPVLNGIVWLASIGVVAYPFIDAFNTNVKVYNKKARLQNELKKLEDLEENKKSKLRNQIRDCEEEKKIIQGQIKKTQ